MFEQRDPLRFHVFAKGKGENPLDSLRVHGFEIEGDAFLGSGHVPVPIRPTMRRRRRGNKILGQIVRLDKSGDGSNEEKCWNQIFVHSIFSHETEVRSTTKNEFPPLLTSSDKSFTERGHLGRKSAGETPVLRFCQRL